MDWPTDLEKELDDSEEKLSSLNEVLEGCVEFTEEQKAYSGCLVTVDFRGDLSVQYGIACATDVPCASGSDNDEELAGTESESKEKGISEALKDDLRKYCQQAAQAALLDDSNTANDILYFSLCSQMLRPSGVYGWGNSLISANFNIIHPDNSLEDIAQDNAIDKITKARDSLDTTWIAQETESSRFLAFSQLSRKSKNNLMTFCVSQMLSMNVRGLSGAQDHVVDQLKVPFCEYWRPTKTNYLKRLSKPQLIAEFGAIRGEAWVLEMENATKGVVVESLSVWFSGEADGPKDERLTWIPPQF